MKPRRALKRLSIPLFFLAWALLFTVPLAAHMGDAVVLARGGDAWLHMWDLWWVDKALVGLHKNPYHTTYLLYPTGLNLYYHSLNLLNGLAAIPFKHLFGLTPAFNLLMLANLTLDGLAAYWLCMDRTESVGAGLVGGALFASMPLLGTSVDLGQLDEVTLVWVPLYILALWRALDSPGRTWAKGEGRRAVLAAGVCLVGASLATWYFTAGLVVFTVVFVATYMVAKYPAGRQELARLMSASLKVAGALFIFALVLSPLLSAMIRERLSGATYMLPTQYATVYNSADLERIFLPFRLGADNEGHGSSVALGYVALALGGLGLVTRRRLAWPVALGMLALVVLALGPQLQIGGNQTGIPLPYALLNNVPFIGASRQPLRFLATAEACLCLLAAFGTAWLLSRLAGNLRRLAVPVLLVLMVLELFGIPRALASTAPEEWTTKVVSGAGTGAVLEVPNDKWSAPSLLHQTQHEQPIMGGYTSRHFPYLFGEAAPGASQLLRGDPDSLVAPDILTPTVQETALASLEYYKISSVVVHKDSLATGRFGRLQTVLDTLFSAKDVVYEDSNVRVYKTPPAPASLSLPLVGLGNGWHKAEQNPLHRWLGSNVTDGNGAVWLGIPPGAAGNYKLSLNVYSYKSPRHLTILLDGRTVAEKEVGTAFEDMDVDLGALGAGNHDLLLKVAEPPENPPGDQRKLSIGVTRISILQTGR